MSHSHVAVPVHFVFSTKDRVRVITPEIEKRLWAYIAGTARGLGMFVHAVGGYDNRYIGNQRQHHQSRSYEKEYLAYLEKYGIPYDPRYIWKTDNDGDKRGE